MLIPPARHTESVGSEYAMLQAGCECTLSAALWSKVSIFVLEFGGGMLSRIKA